MNFPRDFAALLGRVLIAALFIPAGWGKITGFAGTAGYIRSVGLPLPEVGAALAVAIELGCGIMVLVGFKTRWAAAGLLAFLIAASFFFHPFWAVPAEQAMAASTSFWKNVALMGGMLYVWAFGAGRFAVDRA